MACRSPVSAKHLEFRLALITDNPCTHISKGEFRFPVDAAVGGWIFYSRPHPDRWENLVWSNLRVSDIWHTPAVATGADRQSDNQDGRKTSWRPFVAQNHELTFFTPMNELFKGEWLSNWGRDPCDEYSWTYRSAHAEYRGTVRRPDGHASGWTVVQWLQHPTLD